MPVDRAGRVIVQDDLTIPGHPEVQVIGDLANFTAPKTGKPLPGVSPVAIQEGRHAAENILHMVAGAKPQRFYYWDKGSMATIGRNSAVADLNFVHFSGFPAWLAWLFVHVIYLVGFRNRIVVLLPVGLGLRHFQQRRASHHAKLPSRSNGRWDEMRE